MSFLQTLEADFQSVENWINGNPVGKTLVADAERAWAELKSVGLPYVITAIKAGATAVENDLKNGGAAATAFSAGLTAIESSFGGVGATLASATLNTLVTSVLNQVTATATANPA
jgi:hypothetical protein